MRRDLLLLACLEEYIQLTREISPAHALELRSMAAPDQDRKYYARQVVWKRRQEILVRSRDGRCDLCGMSGRQLQAHHINYDNAGMEEFSDFTVACAECHPILTQRTAHLRWAARSASYKHPKEEVQQAVEDSRSRRMMDLL